MKDPYLYCECIDCGHIFLETEIVSVTGEQSPGVDGGLDMCPNCGSENFTVFEEE